jgi:peptidoglycan/xylan/chitin deacetylase (PgdA/CDA1 family)
LPILLRHGVRATFFVATDFIERRRPFWWDRVARIVKTTCCDRIVLDDPLPLDLSLRGARARAAAIRRILRVIKDTHALDLDRFVERLARAAGVETAGAEDRRLADETVMTWEHVTALRRAGMSVQSHTRTHRVLQTLSPGDLRDELCGSRETLERILDAPVCAVAYPVGKSVVAWDPVRRAVADAGYELGFSNATGVTRRSAFDPYDIRRISMDAHLSGAFFRAMLALPWLAY